MRRLVRRIHYLLRRSRIHAELREEMETHRLLRQAQLERQGCAPDPAARVSRLRFGQTAITQDDVADVWTGRLDGWRQDLRQALRSLVARRVFAMTAMGTLAFCIGANLIVFTIVNALWLRSRAIADPERVVMVTGANDLSGTSEGHYFGEAGLDKSVRSQLVFELVAGQVPTSGEMADNRPHITLPGMPGEVETIAASWQYFSVMGLSILGRDFAAEDDLFGAPPVAIISDRLWDRLFRRSPDVLGAEIDSSPVRLRVIGVAPAGFHGARLGEQADLWIPRRLVSTVARPGMAQQDPSLLALARLRPGVSLAAAEQAVRRARSVPPGSPYFVLYRVIPVSRLYGSPASRTIEIQQHRVVWIAAGMAGLVLLAGCATLAALMLVEYERRRQELAIRLALGVSRARLLRALVCELWLLGTAGIVAAVAISSAVLHGLPALSLPGGLDLRRLDLGVDGTVVATGAVVTGVSMLLAALVPLRRSTRPELVGELAAASSRTTPSSHRLRSVILSAHVAATIVLLVAAGVFVQSVRHGLTQAPGFETERLVFAEVKIRSAFGRHMTEAERDAGNAVLAGKLTEILAAVKRHSGVAAVGIGDAPIGLDRAAGTRPRSYISEGRSREIRVTVLDASPEYPEALGLVLLAGRHFSEADVRSDYTAPGDHPVLVTESFAEIMWPDSAAIGRTFAPPNARYRYLVIGVVSDLALGSQRLSNRNGILIPVHALKAVRPQSVEFVVRTSREPNQLLDPIRRAIAAEFPNAPAVSVRTVREILAEDLGRERLGAWFFSGFGLIALALGVGSVFGLVAYLAESRRRELGVRLALGAQPRQITRLLIGAGLGPVALGIAVGLVAAPLVVRLAEAGMPGVRQGEVASLALAGLLMLTGTAMAGLAAARRALRIAPGEVLRAA